MILRIFVVLITGVAVILGLLLVGAINLPWNITGTAFGCIDEAKSIAINTDATDAQQLKSSVEQLFGSGGMLQDLIGAASNGRCVVFKEGDRIFITRIDAAGMVRVQSGTSRIEYWTTFAAVTPWYFQGILPRREARTSAMPKGSPASPSTLPSQPLNAADEAQKAMRAYVNPSPPTTPEQQPKYDREQLDRLIGNQR